MTFLWLRILYASISFSEDYQQVLEYLNVISCHCCEGKNDDGFFRLRHYSNIRGQEIAGAYRIIVETKRTLRLRNGGKQGIAGSGLVAFRLLGKVHDDDFDDFEQTEHSDLLCSSYQEELKEALIGYSKQTRNSYCFSIHLFSHLPYLVASILANESHLLYNKGGYTT